MIYAYRSETGKLWVDDCNDKKIGRWILVLVPMHIFGHSVDMDTILPFARNINLLGVRM